MKKITMMLIVLLALVGCSSEKFDRTYSCDMQGQNVLFVFDKAGNMELRINNSSPVRSTYTQIEKGVYLIQNNAAGDSYVYLNKKGIAFVNSLGEALGYKAKGAYISCLVY